MSILEKIKDRIMPPCTYEAADGRPMTSKELSKLIKTLKNFNSCCAYRMSMEERVKYMETIIVLETALRHQLAYTKDRDIIKKRIWLFSHRIRYKLYDLLGGEK
jgi:CRISPR/Cas system CSM-associated protein Csm2 small subunit